MYAFPIKMDKQNSALAPLFGKAKFFAFYDGQEVLIEKNECNEGEDVALWLKNKGVNNLIIKEMGGNAYKKCKELGLQIYLFEEQRVEIPEVCEAIKKMNLISVDEEKMKEVISKHEKNHTHSHHHNHQYDLKRIVFPTNEVPGLSSKRGAHFGKAKYYTIVKLNNKVVDSFEIVDNKPHDSNGCADAIKYIMDLNPDALVVNGIGASPAKGFLNAGLNVYFDNKSLDVNQSIQAYIKGNLLEVNGATCNK